MVVPVVYRLAASREAIEAARQYELQRPGLGGVFLEEIARIERHVSDAPGLYQLVDESIRRATLRRFPFGLFYLEEPNRVIVLACLDLRQDPQTIGNIVGNR